MEWRVAVDGGVDAGEDAVPSSEMNLTTVSSGKTPGKWTKLRRRPQPLLPPGGKPSPLRKSATTSGPDGPAIQELPTPMG